jgi:hypothetical protein
VANHTVDGSAPSGALRIATRAASTPRVVVSSSNDATLRVPLPPPMPNDSAIAARRRREAGT